MLMEQLIRMRPRSAALAEGMLRAFDLTGSWTSFSWQRHSFRSATPLAWIAVGEQLTALIEQYEREKEATHQR